MCKPEVHGLVLSAMLTVCFTTQIDYASSPTTVSFTLVVVVLKWGLHKNLVTPPALPLT